MIISRICEPPEFSGTTPAFFSARIAPQLVGLGLLEAISESTITSLADPEDANADGISGRVQTVLDPETNHQRLGRFSSKGGKARLSHQIASALNNDMGVTTAIFPKLDGETTYSTIELSAADLDLMTRYVALLGVGARRDLTNAQAWRASNCLRPPSARSATSQRSPRVHIIPWPSCATKPSARSLICCCMTWGRVWRTTGRRRCHGLGMAHATALEHRSHRRCERRRSVFARRSRT